MNEEKLGFIVFSEKFYENYKSIDFKGKEDIQYDEEISSSEIENIKDVPNQKLYIYYF